MHDLGFIFPSECKDDFSKEDYIRFLYRRARTNNPSLSKFMDRVTWIIWIFGLHAKDVSRIFLAEYPLKECQLDEMWTFVKKKEINLTRIFRELI
ncbi:MAG: hypothetical protein ACFFD2_13125 [Promethearchaeota archaeon]